MPRAPEDVPEALLALVLCAGAGPRFAHDSIAALGSADAVVAAGVAELATVPCVGPLRAAAVRAALDAVDVAEERRRMAAAGASFVALGDADYPAALASIPLPPLGVWIRGDAGAALCASAAVVGARRATPYGIAQAGRFAGALASAGITVVSGGARGIDAEAHRAALRVGAPTVAVLGCGLAEPYPPEHVGLFDTIVGSGGLLVSEFPTCYPPLGENFPRRNRIISGLSAAVLVVEADHRSGALVTARYAADDHGREVCALPGPVDAPRSAGTNAAIRDGWAHCVLAPEDLLEVVARSTVRSGVLGAAGPGADGPLQGVPEAIRSSVERATELLARRPRLSPAALGAAIGLPPGEAAAVHVYATLVRARLRGAAAVS